MQYNDIMNFCNFLVISFQIAVNIDPKIALSIYIESCITYQTINYGV